jgi:hypothetical protein
LSWLRGQGEVLETDLGNAGSAIFAINHAVESGADLAYFSEDDYLYESSPGISLAEQYVREGLGISDYVSLYDHPDKYTAMYGLGETSKVLRTPTTHWRTTVSTCMTFGAKVSALKKDLEIWRDYTKGDHPHDHEIFCKLDEREERDSLVTLAVAIPGIAVHTDLTFSGEVGRVLIDDWALNMACNRLENLIAQRYILVPDGQTSKFPNPKWSRLLMLDATWQGIKK